MIPEEVTPPDSSPKSEGSQANDSPQEDPETARGEPFQRIFPEVHSKPPEPPKMPREQTPFLEWNAAAGFASYSLKAIRSAVTTLLIPGNGAAALPRGGGAVLGGGCCLIGVIRMPLCSWNEATHCSSRPTASWKRKILGWKNLASNGSLWLRARAMEARWIPSEQLCSKSPHTAAEISAMMLRSSG
jgi:hypothetical protein